jgi:plastocyanin
MKGNLSVVLIIVAFAIGFFVGKLEMSSPAAANCDTLQVEMNNKEFIPANLNIHPCDTVVWTNKDTGERHTVTFEAGVIADCPTGLTCTKEGESSEELTYKMTFTRAFSEKGTFEYYSTPYKDIMRGKIIVS